MNGPSELSGVRHLGAIQEQSMNDVLKQAAEAIRGLDEAYCRAGALLSREERDEDRKRLMAARAALAALESAQERQGEALVRFCPGCGSIGEVESKYRDCCPDGSHARRIPESLATRCQSLFRAALESAVAPQPLRELSEDRWLPIETAPKDGRIVLYWVNAVRYSEDEETGQLIETDVSQPDLGQWIDGGEHGAGYHDPFAGIPGDAGAPTHWQPLPIPPSAMRAARSAK